jgi:hypothetical protein
MNEANTSKGKWKIINTIILGRAIKTPIAAIPDAETLNAYFADICTSNLNSETSLHHEELPFQYPVMKLLPITAEELISTIYHLPNKSSEGVDHVNTQVLKKSRCYPASDIVYHQPEH